MSNVYPSASNHAVEGCEIRDVAVYDNDDQSPCSVGHDEDGERAEIECERGGICKNNSKSSATHRQILPLRPIEQHNDSQHMHAYIHKLPRPKALLTIISALMLFLRYLRSCSCSCPGSTPAVVPGGPAAALVP